MRSAWMVQALGRAWHRGVAAALGGRASYVSSDFEAELHRAISVDPAGAHETLDRPPPISVASCCARHRGRLNLVGHLGRVKEIAHRLAIDHALKQHEIALNLADTGVQCRG